MRLLTRFQNRVKKKNGILAKNPVWKKKKKRDLPMGVPKTEYEYHFWDRALFFLQGFP